MISSESVNTERERANLLSLIKLTLNTLIDQSSSSTVSPVLDDKNADVTNFILTLDRVLNFRTRANWLSERRYFWDFVRPACLGSSYSLSAAIDRVEEVSKTRSIREKGRTWVKFALMEKKLSELLKLVISDTHLVRKFYHDDSVLTSSQAFVVCDQLAGLNAIDFSFCFKQEGSSPSPPPSSHNVEVEVIDLTPYLCYKSRTLKQLLLNDDENKQPSPMLATMNEMKPLNLSEPGRISLEKHKLEVEQRKYFEELLRHRDRELQQLKSRFETLKSEREKEVVLMENIILELQLELRSARTKSSPVTTTQGTPPKTVFHFGQRKVNSPPTPTNEDPEMNSLEATTAIQVEMANPSIDLSSRRSSQSTSTVDDEQYELARRFTGPLGKEIAVLSSPEMVSSATSLSSDEDESNEAKPVIDESGHFEPVQITAEQVDLLEEASDMS